MSPVSRLNGEPILKPDLPSDSDSRVFLGSVGASEVVAVEPLNPSLAPEGWLGVRLSELPLEEGTDHILWVRAQAEKVPEIVNLLDGSVIIDFERSEITIDGNSRRIPKKPLAILKLLSEFKNKTVTREQFSDQVWDGWLGESNALNMQLAAIRRLLGDYRGLLRTVRGQGYMLDEAEFQILQHNGRTAGPSYPPN